MAALDNQPLTTRLQGQNWFKFQLQRAPSVSFFSHKVKLPGVASNGPEAPTQYLALPKMGDHLMFEPLLATFQVDAQFQNWLEIWNWMNALTNSDGTAVGFNQMERNADYLGYGLYSGIQLFVLDSQQQPSLVFNFENAIPVALSGLEFADTIDQEQYIEATVVFKYVKYTVSLP